MFDFNHRRVIVASETTYGTDQVNAILTDASADIVYQDVEDFTITPVREIVEVARMRGVHGNAAHKTIASHVTVAATGALTARAGEGAGNEAPTYAAFLKAANMSEAIVSDTTATYKPVTKQQAGMSGYQFHRSLESDNWRLLYALGIRGTWGLNLAINAEAKWTFSGQGIYQDEISDEAAFFDASTGAIALLKDGATGVTARAGGSEANACGTPVMCTNMTLEVGGTAYPVSALELALNWTTTPINTINGAANASKILNTRPLTGGRIGGSFTLADGETAHDQMIAAYKAGSEISLSCTLVESDGSSGDANIVISASKMQLGLPAPSDNGGVVQYAIPFFLNADCSSLADGTELSIVYGEVA